MIATKTYLQHSIQSPFGMVMPGRNWTAATASGYGFGFNGKLKDDAMMGNSNVYDFGARIYDARLGRWLGVDVHQAKYPNLSPYNSFNNNPTLLIDPDGKTFYINGNTAQAQQDIKDMIDPFYIDKMVFTDIGGGMMRVDFNWEDGGTLNHDSGAKLLINLTSASENYVYTVSNTYDVLHIYGTGPEINQADVTKDVPPSFLGNGEAFGVQNLSETAYQATKMTEEGKLKGASRSQPVDINGIDIDGQVVVAVNGSWVHPDGTDFSRGEMAFHELWENYERTTNGLPYEYNTYDAYGRSTGAKDETRKGAHDLSVDAQNGTGIYAGQIFIPTKDGIAANSGVGKYIKSE